MLRFPLVRIILSPFFFIRVLVPQIHHVLVGIFVLWVIVSVKVLVIRIFVRFVVYLGLVSVVFVTVVSEAAALALSLQQCLD